jgi:iron complex transport system substrate-binding protein
MNKMKIDRRALLGGLTAALVAPRYSFAASITDATGRTVTAPDRLMRIYPAGPPAAVELYTLAPDLLMGWLEPIGQEEREFLLPESAALPKIPRLTGRDSDDINLGALASLKPDLILDVGNVDAAYSSLAERVQQQSGIPYVLLDGGTSTASARLIARSAASSAAANRPKRWRATPKPRSRRSRSAAPKYRTTRAPVSITPATRAGCKPASAAR